MSEKVSDSKVSGFAGQIHRMRVGYPERKVNGFKSIGIRVVGATMKCNGKVYFGEKAKVADKS